MYLHLGNNVIVRNRDIVGIFDMDRATVSEDGISFLKYGERHSMVTTVSTDLPKSFIVTTEQGNTRIYISGVATRVLRGRLAEQKAENSKELERENGK